MSDMVDLVVLKPVRGIRPGTIVSVDANDALWASKVAAGSAAYLSAVVTAVADALAGDDENGVFDDDDASEEE